MDINDKEWQADKNAIAQLDEGIMRRRLNYNTYKEGVESEQHLYNRERNKTIALGITNTLVVGACIYMWFA